MTYYHGQVLSPAFPQQIISGPEREPQHLKAGLSVIR